MPGSTTKVFNSLRHTLRSGYQAVAEMDVIDLVPRLTLLTLLLSPMDDPGIRPFGLFLAGVGVLFAPAARHPGLWLLLTLLTGWRVIADWPLADNHAYLLCYWCLAVCTSLVVRDVRASLALNGRLLIGLAFAFATLWKAALSPDYLDGTFFRVMLQVDERFAAASTLFGEMSQEQLAANRRALETSVYETSHTERSLGTGRRSPADFLLHLVDADERATVVEPVRFTVFAQILTWWTVIAEAAVALCFLWPNASRLSRCRHLVLLLFCATTYAVVPVAGFAWLLLVMGIAQCEPGRTAVRALYLTVFSLILFYQEFMWTGVLP